MEITKLDSPDDDGLMDRLARLCEHIDGLLDRVRSGEQIANSDLAALQREAVIIGLARNHPFEHFVSTMPTDLN